MLYILPLKHIIKKDLISKIIIKDNNKNKEKVAGKIIATFSKRKALTFKKEIKQKKVKKVKKKKIKK